MRVHLPGRAGLERFLILFAALAVEGCGSTATPPLEPPAPATPPPPLVAPPPSTPATTLLFERNVGQSAAPVRFLARDAARAVFATDDALVLRFASPPAELLDPAAPEGDGTAVVVRMSFPGSTPVAPEAVGTARGRTSTFVGADPTRWQRGVPLYRGVRYRGLYPGVDLLVEGGSGPAYRFLLAPGAALSQVRLRFEGADTVELDAAGNLRLSTAAGPVVHTAPRLYHLRDGRRIEVQGGFRIIGRGEVGFRASGLRADLPLIIDPVVLFATTLGGSLDEAYPTLFPAAVSADGSGGVYVTGATQSGDFPVTTGQVPTAGIWDAVAARFDFSDPAAPAVDWVVVFGGTNQDRGHDIVATSTGEAYAVGFTGSSDFPNPGPQAASTWWARGYTVKLDGSGQVVAATQLASTAAVVGVAVEETGGLDFAPGVYTASFGSPTPSMPVSEGAFQEQSAGSTDAYLSKLTLALDDRLYSTYIGGGGWDYPAAIVAREGRLYVVGQTHSADFPTAGASPQPGPADPTLTAADCHTGGSVGTLPCRDGFLGVLNGDGSDLLLGTYVGAPGADQAHGLDLGPGGRIFVAGSRRTPSGDVQAAVWGVSPGAGTWDYEAEVGGSQFESPRAVAVRQDGDVFLVGGTSSPGLATPGASQGELGGGTDAFIARLDGTGGLVSFTYLGGSGNDYALDVAGGPGGRLAVAGITESADFPLINATQDAPGGQSDLFLAMVTDVPPDFTLALGKIADPDPVPVGGTVTYHLIVANEGEEAISGVHLSDILPPELSVESVFPPTCAYVEEDHAVRCPPQVLAGYGSLFLQVEATATAAGEVCNTLAVEVAGAVAPLTEESCIDAETPLPPVAALEVSFVDLPPVLQLDDEVTYQVVVSSVGELTATGVVASNVLQPAKILGLDLATTAAGTCTVPSDWRAQCELGDMPSGTSASITITAAADNVGQAANEASATFGTTTAGVSTMQTTTVTGLAADLSVAVQELPATAGLRSWKVEVREQSAPAVAVPWASLIVDFEVSNPSVAAAGGSSLVIEGTGSCNGPLVPQNDPGRLVAACNLIGPGTEWAVEVRLSQSTAVSFLAARISGPVQEQQPQDNCADLPQGTGCL